MRVKEVEKQTEGSSEGEMERCGKSENNNKNIKKKRGMEGLHKEVSEGNTRYSKGNTRCSNGR